MLYPRHLWLDRIAGTLSLLDSWRLEKPNESFSEDCERRKTDFPWIRLKEILGDVFTKMSYKTISFGRSFRGNWFRFQRKSLKIMSLKQIQQPIWVRLAPSESTSIIAKFCLSSECLGGRNGWRGVDNEKWRIVKDIDIFACVLRWKRWWFSIVLKNSHENYHPKQLVGFCPKISVVLCRHMAIIWHEILCGLVDWGGRVAKQTGGSKGFTLVK